MWRAAAGLQLTSVQRGFRMTFGAPLSTKLFRIIFPLEARDSEVKRPVAMRKDDTGGVPTLRVLALVFLAVCIGECRANREWNVDQNRLKIAPSTAEAFRSQNPIHDRRFSGQSHQSRYSLSQRNSELNSGYARSHRKHGTGRDEEVAYSHYSPTFITVPPARNIYKSVEDPAAFYKNKVFINSTASEKSQRRPVPRVPYSRSSVSRGDQKSSDISRTPEGVNIRLRGATIRVRPDAASRRTQWSPNDIQNTQNSAADVSLRPEHGPMDNICVRCPAERTVVAGRGRDRAALEQPLLQGCREGEEASAGATFRDLYGPRIGDLLSEGSHITVGSIIIKNETQQLCQYRFNVVVRRCTPLSTPPGVMVTCPRGALWGAACRFSCTDPKHRLKGRARLFCKDDMQWSGALPTCEEPPKATWCDIRPISRHGRMTCDTPSINEQVPSTAAPQGSVCSVWCDGAYRMAAPKILTCKAGGRWQGGPVCRSDRRRRHKKQRKNLKMKESQQLSSARM